MVEAEMHDGRILEFPDGTDPQVIQNTVRRLLAEDRAQEAETQSDPWSDFPVVEPANPWDEFPAVGGTQTGVRPVENSQDPYGVVVPPRVEVQEAPALAPQSVPDDSFTLEGILAAGTEGLTKGAAMLLGAPFDALNNLPRLANAIPGVEGVGRILPNHPGGMKSFEEALRTVGGVVNTPIAAVSDAVTGRDDSTGFEEGPLGLPMVPEYEPRNAAERFAERIGIELGATAIPIGGAAIGTAGRTAAEINRLAASGATGQRLAAQFVQPLVVNPQGALMREGAYAIAAGTGAQAANEVFGEGPWSDTLGSIAGVGGLAAGTGIARAGGNVVSAATGTPAFRGGVVDEAVADRVMNSSQRLATEAADNPTRPVDTAGIVADLRRPALIEDVVPGYRANIADRVDDPGLSTLTYNVDAVSPGAANARRVANDTAVGAVMANATPDGMPNRFHGDLQVSVDRQIAEALGLEDIARQAYDAAAQDVAPAMPTAAARGSSVRSGLADAYSAAQDNVRGLYDDLASDGTLVDPHPLIERATVTDANLAPNDAARFRPMEADTIQNMSRVTGAPYRETGLLNEYGRPIMAENPRPGTPPTGSTAVFVPGSVTPDAPQTVPLSDILSIRTGLTDDVRANRAAGQAQAARIGNQYVDDIDAYLEEALMPDVRARFDAARAARRDVGDRFERPGTANAEVLRTRQGGDYALDDSAVAGRYAQPDSGKISDLKALLREAGDDVRVRDGLADTVLADVQQRGLIDKPERLRTYLGERNVLLSEFPELRTKLEAAGAARADLDSASRAAQDTQKRLTTPSQSPEAAYLQYSPERVSDSVRSVVNARDPRAAARQLVESAGTPEAAVDLRRAFWDEVSGRGELSAPNSAGAQRWSGRKLRDVLNDPKYTAVAEELWADDPEDLANIRQVFEALAGAEGSTRAKAPNTSGTGQAVTGGYDPSLTMGSVASRARSVNRGQLSPTIAAIDLLGTWLRRRTAQVQSRAIDQITAEVVNNPGMAADLLERYNPATAGAYRRMMTQKYGARATTLLNFLDEAANDDPVMDALQEDEQ